MRGVDVNLSPYSLFTKVEFFDGAHKSQGEVTKEPFAVSIPGAQAKGQIVLHFQGHYHEPHLTVDIDLAAIKANGNIMTHLMVYNPFELKWEFCVPI